MTFRVVWLTVLMLAAPVAALSTPPPLGVVSRGTVTRVIDGDTLEVEVKYTIRVRLLDAWAPEKNTAAGRKAADALDVHALGRPCVVQVPTGTARNVGEVTTLGRVLGHVWLEGANQSLSEWQVRNGNATKARP